MRKIVLAYALTSSAALAHGGHEAARAHGDAHWLIVPDHLAVVALGGLAVLIAIRAVLRQRQKTRM